MNNNLFIKQKRQTLIINTLYGIIFGYFLFHPFAHIVDKLFKYGSLNSQTHNVIKTLFVWTMESFSLNMIPMSLIYIVVFGFFGFSIGKQKSLLKLHSIQIKEEQIKREEIKKLYEKLFRNELYNMIAPIKGIFRGSYAIP